MGPLVDCRARRRHDKALSSSLAPMPMMPFLVPAAESGPEQLWDLPMPAWAYGAVAVAVALLLLLLVWAFRNVAGNVIYGPSGPRAGQPRTVEHHTDGQRHQGTSSHGGGH